MEQFNTKNIKAIIGLGNPGQKYSKNRHNIGFIIIDELSNQFSSSFKVSEKMEHAQIYFDSQAICLIKPLTFMNTCGQVIPFLSKKGIKPENILVIHDELEKKFGNISIKFGGSARGHNGLRSIIGIVGHDFWRLRFGIGRPDQKAEVGDYVLANFDAEQENQLEDLVLQAINLILNQ